jgi:hypothetical protein
MSAARATSTKPQQQAGKKRESAHGKSLIEPGRFLTAMGFVWILRLDLKRGELGAESRCRAEVRARECPFPTKRAADSARRESPERNTPEKRKTCTWHDLVCQCRKRHRRVRRRGNRSHGKP